MSRRLSMFAVTACLGVTCVAMAAFSPAAAGSVDVPPGRVGVAVPSPTFWLWRCSRRHASRPEEHSMHGQLTRHTVQVLLAAGHTQQEVATHAGVSLRSVGRIITEQPVDHVDDKAERERRRVGRPSKAELYRALILELLEKEPHLMSLEVLRRCRDRGYRGGKTAMYGLIAQIRPSSADFQMRFEGVPGEFSQHDFGQVELRFLDGSRKLVRFFASRLKWSRWVQVSLVDDERAETLVRTLLGRRASDRGQPFRGSASTAPESARARPVPF